MKTTRSQLVATLVLMAGALVVGMILAGGGKLTPAGFSSPGRNGSRRGRPWPRACPASPTWRMPSCPRW